MSLAPDKPGVIEPAIANTVEFPHSSFFGILRESSGYRSTFYLLMLFPIGIGLFVYSITMLSLSLGLAITILGLPLAYVFLLSLPRLSVVQAAFGSVILGVPMPQVKIPSPQGSFMHRLSSLVKDTQVQNSLILSILIFPYAIFSFVFVITAFSISISFILTIFYPLVHVILEGFGVSGSDYTGPLAEIIPLPFVIAVLVVLGLFLLILSLHTSRYLAYAHAKIVRYVLRP